MSNGGQGRPAAVQVATQATVAVTLVESSVDYNSNGKCSAMLKVLTRRQVRSICILKTLLFESL